MLDWRAVQCVVRVLFIEIAGPGYRCIAMVALTTAGMDAGRGILIRAGHLAIRPQAFFPRGVCTPPVQAVPIVDQASETGMLASQAALMKALRASDALVLPSSASSQMRMASK